MVADEFDLADAGFAPFVDGEDQIDAPVRQLNEPFGHLRFVAAVFLIGVLDSPDVGLGGRLVIGRVRFRLHFDLELLRLDLAVALEGHAVDDLRALAEGDDDLAVFELGADAGIDARRPEVLNTAFDRCRIGSAEIGLER